MKQILLPSIMVLIYSVQSFSQPGVLDKSFNKDGKINLLVGKTGSWVNTVTMQPAFPTDRVVMAGYYYNGSHNNNDFLVVRLTSNGALDNTFSGNGVAGINFGGDDEAYSVIVQPDSKIAVFGTSGVNIAAARLKSTGTLDSSFGTNGKTLITFNGGIKGAAIQPDGKFVLAGSWETGINHQVEFAVIRLNANGTLDNTFGNNGEVFTDFAGGFDFAEAVAIQSNGKIVAAGVTENSSNDEVFAIARYNTNGSLDASFGQGGEITTAIGVSNAIAYAVAIQPNGKILAGGHYYTSSGKGAFALARYRTNGTLDSSFAGNGKAGVSFDDQAYVHALSLQSNGKIIASGWNENSTSNITNVAIARLKTNGVLDNSFGSNGKVTTNFDGEAYGIASVIQSDGKLVVAGALHTVKNGVDRIIAARYFTTASSLIADDENNVENSKITSKEFTVYPNPANNIIHIDGLNFSSAIITIQNQFGNTLIKETITDKNQTININSLKPGVYNLTVLQNGKSVSAKFIKQ